MEGRRSISHCGAERSQAWERALPCLSPSGLRTFAPTPPFTPGMTRVAFLGLGAIGAPMARHLAAPPFELTVWNRTAAKASAFAAATGARVAETPGEAA